MRTVLSYVRTQEDQADHAGVKFLNATGQSPRGMVDLFKRLSSESLFNSRYIDPYMQTHPMPAERVAALETVAKASPYWDRKDSPELQLRHDMMRAKLSGFLERPDTVARRYPATDHSLPARYARAISTYRNSDLRQAIAQIDSLIQAQPNNPYFYELKGQALLEGGHPSEAVAPLRHAVQLSHNNALIEIMLAQALNATGNAKLSEEAVAMLRSAIVREPEAPTPTRSSPWPTAARVIWPMPTLLPRRPPSPAATSRPHVNWPPAPRLVFRSALPHGCGPTTSSTSSRPMPKPASNSHKDKELMKSISRSFAAACAVILTLAAAPRSNADEFSSSQRSEVERIVREYLIAHPEVLQEAMSELDKRQTAAQAEKHKAAIKQYSEALFSSPRQVVLGNPNGNVTFVEFFDYNCGYCKRAMDDMLTLLKDDPKLKVVLKEFPVLGPGSVEAAQVAVAVHMQDKTGKKYLEFHQKLLGGRGEANKARALAVAKDIGLDMARLEKDIASPEVKASLQESFKLAEALGLNGTPSYVIGDNVVVGAVGLEALKEKVNTSRCGKPSC